MDPELMSALVNAAPQTLVGGLVSGYLMFLWNEQKRGRRRPVDSDQFSMMLLAEIKDLSRKVDQQSKDMGIYQSAQEKAARDRHDEVIETIDASNQMLIARLEKLERTA